MKTGETKMRRSFAARLDRLESVMNPRSGLVIVWGTDAECERQQAEMVADSRASEGTKFVWVQWSEHPDDIAGPRPEMQG